MFRRNIASAVADLTLWAAGNQNSNRQEIQISVRTQGQVGEYTDAMFRRNIAYLANTLNYQLKKMAQKIAAFSPEYGRRIKSVIDAFTPQSPNTNPVKNPNAILSGFSSPVEITGEWEQDQAVWKCKAKRLWRIDGNYETRDDNIEIDLYDPCGNAKPEVSVGDRVYAVFRGVWEMVGSVGGGESKIYAVVMSAIHCPSDPTLDPEDSDFRDKMGEIKIEGKTYEKDENNNYIGLDQCACRELAGKDDEYPEQIVKGTQIEVIKAGSYDNPDYDQEAADEAKENDEPYDVPEKLDWYLAVETKGEYLAKIDDDLQWDGDEYGVSTFTVKDSDGEEVKMSVSGEVITQGYKITGNAESYKIVRKDTGEGKRMVAVGGRCQQKVEG